MDGKTDTVSDRFYDNGLLISARGRGPRIKKEYITVPGVLYIELEQRNFDNWLNRICDA